MTPQDETPLYGKGGVTLNFMVNDVDKVYNELVEVKKLQPIRDLISNPWGDRSFILSDPLGNRLYVYSENLRCFFIKSLHLDVRIFFDLNSIC